MRRQSGLGGGGGRYLGGNGFLFAVGGGYRLLGGEVEHYGLLRLADNGQGGLKLRLALYAFTEGLAL